MEKYKNKFLDRVKENKKTGCFVWKGTLDKDGYGRFVLSHRREIRAHRYSFIIYNGEIPKGLFVCHSCDNPSCVNPDHLWLGTALQNNRDAWKKGRRIILKGESHGMAKLNNNNVKEIRSLYKEKFTQKQIAKKYKVSREMIGRIVRNENWI